MGNAQSSSYDHRRPPPQRDERDIFHGSHRSLERNRSRHCFLVRSQRPENGVGNRCCCPPPVCPPVQRSAPAAANHPLFRTGNFQSSCPVCQEPPQQLRECDTFQGRTGNAQSLSYDHRRPPPQRSERDTFQGSHRSPERNRSRHCFLVRSQRPACPPAQVAPSARQRCCCPMPKKEIIPPAPVRQNACYSSGRKPQRCFNNCAGRTEISGKGCHPDAYPVPELPRTNPACLHPLGDRCNWDDRKEMVNELPRAAAPAALAIQPAPPMTLSPSCSVKSFQPAVTAINETCEEPQDQYYPYPPRSTRLQGFDPLANFDLNRFDRDATHRGGGGRRRNVSIRTCVDYDYEPDYSPRQRPYHPPGPSEYPQARSHPPPAHAPRFRRPSPPLYREP